MRSSGSKFWRVVGKWLTEKPNIGVEFESRLQWFAFKGVVANFREGESITLEDVENGELKTLDLTGAEVRLVEMSRARDLDSAEFVRVFRAAGEGFSCTLTEFRDFGRPV